MRTILPSFSTGGSVAKNTPSLWYLGHFHPCLSHDMKGDCILMSSHVCAVGFYTMWCRTEIVSLREGL